MLITFASLCLASWASLAAADAPDCTTSAPCLEDLGALAPLLSSSGNETLFAPSDAVCGNTYNEITRVATGECFGDLLLPEGCPCEPACAAVTNTLTLDCRLAIMEIFCLNAYWIEPQFKVNLRSVFLHIFNDCTDAEPYACPPSVPPFDPAVCAPPDAPAAPGASATPAEAPAALATSDPTTQTPGDTLTSAQQTSGDNDLSSDTSGTRDAPDTTVETSAAALTRAAAAAALLLVPLGAALMLATVV